MIIVLIFALAIFKQAMKGLKRGFARSAMALSIMVFSMICAGFGATLISHFVAELLGDTFFDVLPFVGDYVESVPSIKIITTGMLEVLMGPIIFVALYFIVRLVFVIVFQLIARRSWKKSPDAPARVGMYRSLFAEDNPSYVGEDAPWIVRHDRLMGAVTSGICGFLGLLIFFSPFIGLFNNMRMIYMVAEEKEFDWNWIGVGDEAMEYVDMFVNDGMVATLGLTGGLLIYDGVSSATLIEGKGPVTFRGEMNACIELSNDLLAMFDAISSNGGLGDEQIARLSEIVHDIEKSDTLLLLTTDIVSGVGTKWYYGEAYLGISRPDFGDTFDAMFDEILRVCGGCEHECVIDDLDTMINIFQIIKESGLDTMTDTGNVLTTLDDNGLLDKIYDEIDKNICMREAQVTSYLMGSTLTLMAKSISATMPQGEDRTKFMNEMANSVNFVNNMKNVDFADRVEYMTDSTLQYAEKYGYQMPESVAEMAVTSMLNSIDEGEQMNAAKMDELFKQYEEGNIPIEGGTAQ